MIELDDVLCFDTETTGIPEKGITWDADYERFPRIVSIAWTFAGLAEYHIIRPEGWEIPAEAVEVHGITTEYALENGEPIQDVLKMFVRDCLRAILIAGHNIYFDVSIVKSELMRAGLYDEKAEQALYKGKRIDTMRSSMKFVGARRQNGGLKFPNLSELFARCFPGETFEAHDALEDTIAVERCLPILVDAGCIELKVKEYQEEQGEPKNEPQSDFHTKDDKRPIQEKKTPYEENQAKITDKSFLSDMMNDDEF